MLPKNKKSFWMKENLKLNIQMQTLSEIVFLSLLCFVNQWTNVGKDEVLNTYETEDQHVQNSSEAILL